MPDDSSSGKRGAPRFKIEGLEGKLPLASQVEILNVSMGGVSLKVDRRLAIRSECPLKLQQGSELLAVKAVVVWSALTGFRKNGEESTPEYSVGMRFTDLVNGKVHTLATLIDQNKAFKAQQLSALRVELSARGRTVISPPHPSPFKLKLIGINGMLIETSQPLAPETVYPLEIAVDGTPFKLEGTVASQFELETDQHEVGVLFHNMSVGDRALLKASLQVLSRAPRAR